MFFLFFSFWWVVQEPLWKNDGVRQWKGWHPICDMENNPFMFQSPLTRWFPICLTKTWAFSGKIRRPSLPSDQSHLQLVNLQALWPPGRRGIEPENWWLNGGLPELYLENFLGFTEMESWRHEILPTDMVVWWEEKVSYITEYSWG